MAGLLGASRGPCPAARRGVAAAAVASVLLGAAGFTHAQGTSRKEAAGAEALAKARTSWDDGELDRAAPEYAHALEKGGLNREETLECYVRIGALRAVLGKKHGAIEAFRVAVIIDPDFVVPPETGKKATALADTVREQHLAPIRFEASAPAEVDSGAAFAVNVLLDPSEVAAITRLGMTATDPTTKKTYRFENPASTVVHFRVPGTMTLPGARLRIHVDALDAHDNQLGFAEQHVEVRPEPVATGDAPEPHHGGFWSGPWPYVIGGALLAAGGATAGYFLLRTPDQVLVGPAQIQPSP